MGKPAMLCPRCATPLIRTPRRGHILDSCPTCGGAWIEAGVLEHILGPPQPERMDVPSAPPPDVPSPHIQTGHDDDRWAHRPGRPRR
ncbi:MAG: zf-TFIIB domain-containing protein [Magnetospirillum sp.]|nr:zf-TFIIB domain-containing protein [Magnetospirillum sp.]